jgi:hypothetical protein
MPFRKKLLLGLSILALVTSAGAISSILERAEIDVDGQVIWAETTCDQPYNNRCVTRYVLRTRTGSEVIYAAMPGDSSLARRLPIGTWITKHKWDISYSVDGKRIDDFPLRFYVGILVVGAFVGLGWIARSISGIDRQKWPDPNCGKG